MQQEGSAVTMRPPRAVHWEQQQQQHVMSAVEAESGEEKEEVNALQSAVATMRIS
eukprot:EC785058.1.p3 GENE.EC785058.1~~EC785058.1.p3  ORF type:complete len:55 (+),score=19.16 EC785058.1:216-380(+)